MTTQTKKYLAVVEEINGCKTMTRKVDDTPNTLDALKTSIDATKIELKSKQKALQQKRKEVEATEEKRYKRPRWEDAYRMEISCEGVTETKFLDVLLTDSWAALKDYACQLFDLQPKDYSIEFHCVPNEEKVVRKKSVPVQIGELCLSDGRLELKKKSTGNEDSTSDSTSDSDSSS